MMNMLTEPMKRLIESYSAGAIATTNENGTPAVSPKATFVVVNDECIAFGNIRSPGTVANVGARPDVEVNFIDVLARRAVRIRGRAEVVEKESEAGQRMMPAFNTLWAPYLGIMQSFVSISITHAELILSPAYDLGHTAVELQRVNLDKLCKTSSGLHDGQIPQEVDPDSGLPIGPALARPESARSPQRVVLDGRYCRLEPLDPERHGEGLYAASTPPDAAARFRYLPDSAPTSVDEFSGWMATAATSEDPLFFAVIDKRSGRIEGRQTLMRITPLHQCIEIGNIYWGPSISQTPVTTEANFLFARYIFEELGYRRYEWKCDALNAPSRRAALRFGFRYEGHFRRAVIIRGRSRDTAWYSIIDEEWPSLKAAYEQWLAPENFDTNGKQKSRMSELTAALMDKA